MPAVHLMCELQICTPIKVTYKQQQEKSTTVRTTKKYHQRAGNKADKKDRESKMKIPTVLQIRIQPFFV